jgi:hypothetical protein
MTQHQSFLYKLYLIGGRIMDKNYLSTAAEIEFTGI